MASASLEGTCCNITLDNVDRSDPKLGAVCQTNRFRKWSGCQDLDNAEEWRATNLSVNSCPGLQPGSKDISMVGHLDGCNRTLLEGTPLVLSTDCAMHQMNFTLGTLEYLLNLFLDLFMDCLGLTLDRGFC